MGRHPEAPRALVPWAPAGKRYDSMTAGVPIPTF